MVQTFKYFAYGSNLARYRLSLSCPSCVKKNVGRITGYDLVYGKYAEAWKGGVASIKKPLPESQKKDAVVWGVIWEIDDREMAKLDEQEGVHVGYYRPMTVDVLCKNDETVTCRTYQIDGLGQKWEFCEPSPQYLKVLMEGCEQSGLPEHCFTKLKSTKTNNNSEITEHMKKIQEMKRNLNC